MTQCTFFRLLKTPIDAKGDALAAQVAALNTTGEAEETFTLEPVAFAQIPGSPFAYWISEGLLRVFVRHTALAEQMNARLGVNTTDDFRFVRLLLEVPADRINTVWLPLAKGGGFEKYYGSFHLCIDWENNGQRLKSYIESRGDSSSRNVRSEGLYGQAGLTYASRTQKGLGFKPLPTGTLFTVKGPIVTTREPTELAYWLGMLNSQIFAFLVRCQMAFGSYEIGVMQRTPVPPLTHGAARLALVALASEAHDLQRARDLTDETTQVFCLPALARHHADTLREVGELHDVEAQTRSTRLTTVQGDMDTLVFDLYGLDDADRDLVRAEMGDNHGGIESTEDATGVATDATEAGEEEAAPAADLRTRVQDLFMWCVGVALGRWDARLALDPTLLPALQGPFDPLPRCAPGALVGTDGLPPAGAADIASEAWLRARQNVLDLPPSPSEEEGPGMRVEVPIAWDGILVDDPTHPSDIVARVRGVLALLWGDRADEIEREAYDVLGIRDLREYFRDPRGFFAFHIKRYSKSRRKAPIYWLLQSERRSYGIWLYYHRLGPMTLLTTGRDYADAKVALEQARLAELRQGLEGLSGAARKRREQDIEKQGKLAAEVTAFRNRLDAIALLNLPPDLNDGVLLSIAPLHGLVSWKEAERTWKALVAGEYAWSTMARQMRAKGLVQP